MTHPILHRARIALATICVVGLAVALCSWFLAGTEGVQIAGVAFIAALFIAIASEGVVQLTKISHPVQRMFGTMYIRGFGAALAILAGLAAGCDAKLLALIALPMYLSLVAVEVIEALKVVGSSHDKPSDTPTPLSI